MFVYLEFFTTRYLYCRRSPNDHANFELELTRSYEHGGNKPPPHQTSNGLYETTWQHFNTFKFMPHTTERKKYNESCLCCSRWFLDPNFIHADQTIQQKEKRFLHRKKNPIMEELYWFKHVRYVVICCEAMYLNSRSLNWISYKRSLESCCQRKTTRKNWKRLFVIW